MYEQFGVRVRAGTRTDLAGDSVTDWSPGAVGRLTIERLAIQPKTEAETTTSTRNTVVTGLYVQSEPGTTPDITARDRLEVDGLTWEVDGDIARWPDSNGGVHHVEFALRRVTG